MGVLSPRKSGRTAPEDEALPARVAAGDSGALETLYDRYARVVYSTALRILGTAELAEEVVQEAFWRVWRRSGTFQSGRGQVSSWILGIAHNLAIEEQRRLISAALEQIPIEQREAIELAYFGGLSQSEIAARLQNPLGTVKTRIRLGLQKLRDILTAQGLQPLGLDE